MAKAEEVRERQIRLAQFGRTISGQTRLEDLLEKIAEEVKQILAADRCSVFLADSRRRQLWSKVAHGMGGAVLRIPIDQGVAGFVAKTGNSLNVPNAYRDRRFSPDLDRATGYRTKSILAVPLKDREGKVLGVFQVLNKKAGAFDEEDEGFLCILASVAATAIENTTLYESLKRSHLETIYRLATVAEYRDQEDTARHLGAMSKYSGIIAEGLGLGPDMVENIRYASPLHDIGKVAISDAILRKPGRLTPEEFDEMKRHTEYGARILENAESDVLRVAHRVAAAHHERFDGTGYPQGLKGEKIPLEARIISVADVFDALTTKRVYKEAWSVEETSTGLGMMLEVTLRLSPRPVEVSSSPRLVPFTPNVWHRRIKQAFDAGNILSPWVFLRS